jgi:4-hydroxybenzoate polyprenyltransferase
VTSALVMSYALYTIQSEAAAKHPYLRITLPFVLYGIFRYLYLIHRKNQGESPDEVVLRDYQLIVSVLLWGVVTALVILYQAPLGR